jgi:hypothetical protein
LTEGATGAGPVVRAIEYLLDVGDRTFEITFLDPGARAYVFTFG